MKTGHSFHRIAVASLREYVTLLQESGLDGIPVALAGAVPAAAGSPAMSATAPPGPDVAGDGSHGDETLERIRKELGECQRCKLGKSRKNLVFGVGNPRARLVFVGEGPGADEDRQGEPFVGAAGQVLNRIITAMGMKREDVYICNVVKCRPPENRDPEPEEIAACSAYMLRQLRSIRPEAVVALGKFAAQTLLETREPISKLRGKFRDFHGIPLMPTYHPSFLLRAYNVEAKREAWEDLKKVLHFVYD